MAFVQSNVAYLWSTVVLPRLGCAYVWGGSFSGSDVSVGTDCTGAASAEVSALMRGPDMIWERQFWTGTFAGIGPGATGPFGGVEDTAQWVCVADPSQVPADYVMIIAVIQDPDAENAHMIVRVGGVDIEMGGQSNNYHTSNSDPTCASVMDTNEFNQFFYIPSPGIGGGGAPPPPVGGMTTYTVQPGDSFSSIATQLRVSLAALEGVNPQVPDFSLINPGEVINVPATMSVKLKSTGEPTYVGEVRVQAGAVATAVRDKRGGLVWEVHRVNRTKKLAHLDHWKPAR